LEIDEPGTYRVAASNSFGEGAPSPDKIVVADERGALIDRMTGKWDVHEYFVNMNAPNNIYTNDHVITITKVDRLTIEISDFSGTNDPETPGRYGDTVTAEVDNYTGTMRITSPVLLTPSWAADQATMLLPAFSNVIGENMGREFPVQTITEDAGGKLKMVLKTGERTQQINTGSGTITAPVTYLVISYQMAEITRIFSYYLDTVWTKQ
jgi:hypothetical protein